MKLQFAAQCSTEALREVFDPAYAQKLSCPLGNYVLLAIVAELLGRGEPMTEPMLAVIRGPDMCPHGRSTMGTCSACDGEFEHPEEVLADFCDLYRQGQPYNPKRLYEAIQAMGIGYRKCDPNHDQEAPCAACGHTYERHFDPFEGDREVGCKYCQCSDFVEPTKPCPEEGAGT